jgi:hypothetical protein
MTKEEKAEAKLQLQMRAIAVVQEMAANQEILFGDEDRDYVLGLAYLVDQCGEDDVAEAAMQCPIAESEYPRLQDVYGRFQKYQLSVL